MNAHVDELLALYALGGLEPDENEMVDAHLSRCAACRAEADRQTALVTFLAASVPPAVPHPRLRTRLLARAGIQAVTPRSTPGNAPRLWLALPRWLVVGASLALAMLVGWNVYLTRQLDSLQRQVRWSTGAVALMSAPATDEIALEGQGAFTAASGQAYVNHDSQNVVLIVRRLTPLAAGKTYQAWLITTQGPLSAGLFDVNDTGWGMTWLDIPFSPGSAIGVSVEPQGGSMQPTEVVLLGGL